MSQDQEWIVRLQFLEEAQEYLNAVESSLIGLGDGPTPAQLDSALRATHSIKGGSAMMGFEELSHVGHRMEDFFKVLKGGKKSDQISGELEQLFLSGCDRMRQMVERYRQRSPIDSTWLDEQIHPILNKLYDRLGEPAGEDEVTVISAEAGGDMRAMMFEEEVGPCLDRLEGVLATPELPMLRQEFQIASQELAGLGEMLDLTKFAGLCHQIAEVIATVNSDQLEAIATEILATLRRCHGLVLIGQLEAMPHELELFTEPNITETWAIAEGDSGDDVAIANDPKAQEEDEPATRPEPSLETMPELDQVTFDPEALDTLWNDAMSVPESVIAEAHDNEDSLGVATAPSPKEALAEVTTQAVPIATPINTKKSRSSNKKTAAKASIRVPTQQIERLSELFGELNTERNGLSLQLKHMRSLVTLLSRRVKSLDQANQQLRQSYDRVATQIPTTSQHPTNQTIATPTAAQLAAKISSTAHLGNRFDSLEMDHYSDFHLLSQELIESVVQIQEVTSDLETALSETEGSSREISRTSQQMQLGMTQVRMRPLTDVTNRFPRVLRELSLRHGKEVSLQVQGGSTLIERGILEALQDPLMHLLRNCFDHGLESPRDRIAQGKPAEGTITIRSGYRGNQVFITVQDDGAGINLDKIRAKVRKIGLTEADIAASGEQALLNMIFEPGFSTAESVTALSGRGVGMDVVRTNLESIRGTVQVETTAGAGTIFTITVPLSLSVTRVLVVETNGMLMAFPANIVEEMQLLSDIEIQTAANQEIVQWQGYTVPLMRLQQWMKFARPPIKAETEATPIIDQQAMLIVSQGQEAYALQCDRYWGEQEVTTRTVEGNVVLPPGFSGCVVLGDGRVVPLVDIEPLLTWILKGGPLSPQRTTTLSLLSSDAQQKTVMIVDDSITVRRFLAITLEKAGYRVEQAKDGQDAIEKLKSGTQPNAIICDIEMPRLDGFGFLGQVKSLKEHRHIPVMMLTSRSGAKHRSLAMSLGATDYFSKPFKKQALLKVLEQVVETPAALATV